MFIDFYTESEKEGRNRTILPISQIKNIRVFDNNLTLYSNMDLC